GGLVDSAGRLLHQVQQPTPAREGAGTVLAAVRPVLDELAAPPAGERGGARWASPPPAPSTPRRAPSPRSTSLRGAAFRSSPRPAPTRPSAGCRWCSAATRWRWRPADTGTAQARRHP